MMFKKSRDKGSQAMARQEAAVWLGRALSSSEVTIRILLQLTDVILLQQQVIQALYEQQTAQSPSPGAGEALQEMEQGLSDNLQAKLNELSEQLHPILKIVDESCQNLESML